MDGLFITILCLIVIAYRLERATSCSDGKFPRLFNDIFKEELIFLILSRNSKQSGKGHQAEFRVETVIIFFLRLSEMA